MVKYLDVTSTAFPMESSILRGSVLGRLLFSIYTVTDLPPSTEITIATFADDTALLASHAVTSHGTAKCNYILSSHLTQDPVFGFWSWTFALSKLVEFCDTAFIVLRKQPLIFLHWYHHVTVLLYTWFSYAEATENGKWFGLVNSFVHAWMYSYYALKAMRFNIPKWVAMFVTTLQLSQMVVGCILTASAYYYVHSAQVECHVTPLNIKLAMLMYLSYFILFVRFFQQAYLSNKHIKKIGKKD
uniref:elongation of very long chain fatty acids protein 6-like n=1 Tax=Bombus vancouverensis nearcticus TaxID=2705178 RepID=UPI00143BFC9D|nr:elongation of very long chain fatty acids protein 6-like [Bombus vancouverensis nearcticus]